MLQKTSYFKNNNETDTDHITDASKVHLTIQVLRPQRADARAKDMQNMIYVITWKAERPLPLVNLVSRQPVLALMRWKLQPPASTDLPLNLSVPCQMAPARATLQSLAWLQTLIRRGGLAQPLELQTWGTVNLSPASSSPGVSQS